MTPLEELANKLRTFWLRDIGASAASVSGSASDGSVALARTVFVPAAGGLVGINQIPTDPYALDVMGHARFAGHLYARAGNQWNMGADGAPWGAIYASELHVGTLIAENKIATTGGRILVSPSTKLILAMTTGATTIDVAANTLTSGDRIYLESTGKLEWMAVTSGATAVTGGYRYSVTRNLNGAGAQTWSAGDAIVNTGQSGQGFIDLYSRYGIPANGQTSTTRQGPTIVGNVRTGSTFDAIKERWAVGNLKGLYDYAATAYGLAAGDPTAAWISVDATNGIRLVNNATVLGQWTAAGAITIGEVAAGKSNVAISSGQLDLRSNATNRISLTSAGILTIRNSSGNAVFTFDSSAGAEFTLPLTLATTGGIYQGTGTFASPTTGLKIYNSGGVGLIAGYNGGTAQWYADTDGKLYAGGGAVKLDSTGISLAMGSGYTTENAIKFGTANDVLIYSGYSFTTKRLFVTSQPAADDSAEINVWARPVSGAGTGLIDLTANTPSLSGGGGYAGVGYIRIRGSGAHTVWGSLGFLGTTSGTATIVAPAVAGTPTLTLPTSTGTFALTSDVTAAVAGTSGAIAKFTAANVVGNSIITESGGAISVTGAFRVNGAADVAQAIIKGNATQTSDLTQWQDSAANVLAKVTGLGKFVAITPTTSAASLNLPAGTAPSSPASGDVWHDSTRKAGYGYFAGVAQALVGCIFTGTADASCANTLTETSLMPSGVGTLTLPANFLTVGKTIRITLRGKMSKGTTSTTRKYTLYLGGSAVLTHTTAAGTTALTDDEWDATVLITCRSTGVSGTVYAQGHVHHYTVTDAPLVGTSTFTVDTTASKALDFKFQWSATDASHSITATHAMVEVLQ